MYIADGRSDAATAPGTSKSPQVNTTWTFLWTLLFTMHACLQIPHLGVFSIFRVLLICLIVLALTSEVNAVSWFIIKSTKRFDTHLQHARLKSVHF